MHTLKLMYLIDLLIHDNCDGHRDIIGVVYHRCITCRPHTLACGYEYLYNNSFGSLVHYASKNELQSELLNL